MEIQEGRDNLGNTVVLFRESCHVAGVIVPLKGGNVVQQI